MSEAEDIKKQIATCAQLENISMALQQSAAMYLHKTKSTILKSRPFLHEAWKTYSLVEQLKLPKQLKKKNAVVLAIAPNQGMYGKLVWDEMEQVRKAVFSANADLMIVGTKAFPLAHDQRIRGSVSKFNLKDNITYDNVRPISEKLAGYNNIVIVYPEYHDAFSQKVVTTSLKDSDKESKENLLDLKRYSFDPNLVEVKQYFDQAVLNMMIFRYLLEAMLSYKAAEIVSMKRAHDSAHNQLIENKFKYFRCVRQIVDVRLREVFSSIILWGE